MSTAREIVLVRHAETEWSLQGRHTGRTDLPLTADGRRDVGHIRERLEERELAAVLVSPLRRARETCELCGLGALAEVRDELAEWDYGDYEGLTTAEVRMQRPGWLLWRDGCPNGEDATAVGRRAEKTIEELLCIEGDVVIFSHGHLLRVLAARWIELAPEQGARMMLAPAGTGALSSERGIRAISHWNEGGAQRARGRQ